MKTGTVQLGNASIHIGYSQVVPANQRGKARELSEFFVPNMHRGQGEGSALLDEICQQADQYKILLIIRADNDRLQRLYSKFGFRTIQDNGVIIMARAPN